MPILTPIEAYYIHQNNYSASLLKELITMLLPYASANINLNIKTIEIHEQFHDFISKNTKKLEKILEIKLNDINYTYINDYYNYFLQRINQIQIKHSKKYQNIYVENDSDEFFIPISNNNYSCYISKISYAILVLKKSISSDENSCFTIKLISILLAASGHSLILCSSKTTDLKSIKCILSTSLFCECHIFHDYKNIKTIDYLKSLRNIYCYAYITSPDQIEEKNDNPYVQLFQIANAFSDVFQGTKNPFSESEKKYKCQNKFTDSKIIVRLYNYGKYRSKNQKECWIPYENEKFGNAFINSNDFMEWHGQRIKCYSSFSTNCDTFYLNFDEIHFMKLDHHILNPLYLIGIDYNTISTINFIKENLTESTKFINRMKSKRSNTDKFFDEKMLYSFHKIYKHCIGSDDQKIVAYPTQIYVVNHALNYLEKNKYNPNHKGCIYQVKTGEGKSIIINALAEIFARMGKKVHIVTSNIVLACRDYEKSFDYFKKCKFQSAILLHKKEFNDIENKSDEKYPTNSKSDFYHETSFNNASNMNTKIFRKNKACDIVFSTFFNFEAWYLRQKEENPLQLFDYFKNCYLIIDESDTILIDELTNGTIIARNVNSKCEDILETVYNLYETNESKEKILDIINKKWPECDDIKIDDINSMNCDIESAKSFQKDLKYILEEDDEKKYWEVIPFDSEHKGITEKNKQFSGFIHQFIGIKEKKLNPDKVIKVQPLSLDYLFMSHQIFISQYNGVWGFTGTIGSQDEIDILRKYYKIDTLKIPYHQTNYRKDLPSILCSDINERNQKILEEIQFYNQIKCPVLVIFENRSEISDMKTLIQNNIKNANILTFDGKILNKSEIEKKSGECCAITLGTNYCGRGTDILYNDDFPLHVIITYGPLNIRAIQQAYGRTGRNEKKGTTRIICLKDAYHSVCKMPDQNSVDIILNEYILKNQKQTEYLQFYQDKYPWIFNCGKELLKTTSFELEEIKELNYSFINVNRRTADNYNFPICMKIDTFHKIQMQKIYSLKNCPECKYTWILFQKYIREFILETWSLFINEVQKDLKNSQPQNEDVIANDINYNMYFSIQFEKLKSKMESYFPNCENKSMKSLFMDFHRKVTSEWSDKIKSFFPIELLNYRKNEEKRSLLFSKTGYYPFELKDKSGMRICVMDQTSRNQEKRKISFIEDPELIYDKWSITHIVDNIFEEICYQVDKNLSNYFGMNFFIRRGLTGCEFGICIGLPYDDIKIGEYHCLIDKIPMFVHTITVKSFKPFLAAVLIIILVFITIIIRKIIKIISTASNPKIAFNILVTLGKCFWNKIKKIKSKSDAVISMAESELAKEILLKIIKCLQKKIIKISHDTDDIIFMNTILINLTNKKFTFNETDENSGITASLRIDENAQDIYDNIDSLQLLVKIGILFCLLISVFIKNFKAHYALKHSADYTNEYKNEEEIKSEESSNLRLNEFNSYNQIEKDVERTFTDFDIDDEI